MAPPAKKTTPPAVKPAEQQQADAERAAAEQATAEQEAAAEQTEQAAKGRSELRREADTKEERQAAADACVVSDGTPHMGRALPGKRICSAHEMHYLPDGTPRVKAHAAAQRAVQQPDGGTLPEGA